AFADRAGRPRAIPSEPISVYVGLASLDLAMSSGNKCLYQVVRYLDPCFLTPQARRRVAGSLLTSHMDRCAGGGCASTPLAPLRNVKTRYVHWLRIWELGEALNSRAGPGEAETEAGVTVRRGERVTGRGADDRRLIVERPAPQ